jgi:hypothetical protein
MKAPQRRALAALLVGGSILLAGCTRDAVRPVDGDGNEATAIGEFAWYFSDPKDLVATAPLIVLGTVERVDRGRSYDHGDEVETTRLLTVRVEKRLAGRLAGDRVVIEDQGWMRHGGKEVPFRLQQMLRLEAGDRVYLFLRKPPGSSRYEQLNHQAAYRVEGTGLADSARTDAMVRLVETMSAAQLEQFIGQALAEVRQGRLKATPRGRPGERSGPSSPAW